MVEFDDPFRAKVTINDTELSAEGETSLEAQQRLDDIINKRYQAVLEDESDLRGAEVREAAQNVQIEEI